VRGIPVLLRAVAVAAVLGAVSPGPASAASREPTAFCTAITDIAAHEPEHASFDVDEAARYARELRAAVRSKATPSVLKPALRVIKRYFELVITDTPYPQKLSNDTAAINSDVGQAYLRAWNRSQKVCEHSNRGDRDEN
jgi:hypothetical protein